MLLYHNVGDYHDYCFSKKLTNVVVLGGSALTMQVASALLPAFVPACLVNMEGGMKLG